MDQCNVDSGGQHHVNKTISQLCGHWWYGDNQVNYGYGFKFGYSLQCSAVDVDTFIDYK